MFGFWKKAANVVEQQIEGIRFSVNRLLERDGNGGYKARPGVTPEQIQKANDQTGLARDETPARGQKKNHHVEDPQL